MFKTLAIQLVQEESDDLIQMINPEQESDIKPEDLPTELSILPIKNTVLFPGVVIPITVGRQKSIKLVKKAYQGSRIIGVVAQKNAAEEPVIDDLYRTGTVARIIKMLVLPDGNTTIIIQGKSRFKVKEFLQEEPYLTASFEIQTEPKVNILNKQTKALSESLKDAALKVL